MIDDGSEMSKNDGGGVVDVNICPLARSWNNEQEMVVLHVKLKGTERFICLQYGLDACTHKLPSSHSTIYLHSIYNIYCTLYLSKCLQIFILTVSLKGCILQLLISKVQL